MDNALFPVFQAAGCVVVALAAIVVTQRRQWGLDCSLIAASFTLALLKGIWPWTWAGIALRSCLDLGLLGLLCALTSILLLSNAMEISGQSHRLAEAMRRHIRSTKVRLMFFPALVGLLPVPGGAIFSCPMVSEVAQECELTPLEMSAINYWFRHIWEAVWPLFPGFILFCALSELGPLEVISYTWPIWIAGVASGWLFFLRGVRVKAQTSVENASSLSRWAALKESSSLLAALAGAFSMRALFPDVPASFSFALGFCLGIGLCLASNRLPPSALGPVLAAPKNLGILRVVVAVFIFKGVLIQSGVMDALSGLTEGSRIALFAACVVLPLIGGVFTGIQFGLVGITFPILIPMVQHAGLWDDRLIWLGLASMCGYVGQLITPVHVCLVVTCRFFDARMGPVLMNILKPSMVLLAAAIGWFLLHVTW